MSMESQEHLILDTGFAFVPPKKKKLKRLFSCYFFFLSNCVEIDLDLCRLSQPSLEKREREREREREKERKRDILSCYA